MSCSRLLRSSLRSRTLTTSTPAAEQRAAERVAKRSRRDAVAEKRAAVEAYLASMGSQQTSEPNNEVVVDETRGELWRKEERTILVEEAGFLGRSLYRACLRSVNVLRPGNQYDEKDFKAREEQQYSEDHAGGAVIFSMEPPVNRDNELQSRADYYYTHMRENYNSDSQCLDRDPWKEHDVEVFLHFLRTGEKRRRYVLKDYRFKDPYRSMYDAERIKQFETRAADLLRDTYEANGWLLQSDIKPEDYDTEHDPDFDFEDDPEEKLPKV